MRKKILKTNFNKNSVLPYLSLFPENFDDFIFLNSNMSGGKNDTNSHFSEYDFLMGFGKINKFPSFNQNNFHSLKLFYEKQKDWLFGFFSYDLKNETESLKSLNFDGIQMPQIYFFQPEIVVYSIDNTLTLEYLPELTSENEAEIILEKILNFQPSETFENQKKINIKTRISKELYLEKIETIKQHIRRGDIYEANFCQEFYAENAKINPEDIYLKLNKLSPMPFSVFLKTDNKFLISASPERFLKKKGKHLFSQPMKGTARRGKNTEEDEKIKQELFLDPKERAENVMIVDLVRNDLSRSAAAGSVEVSELFGVYQFPGVFQMISTVESQLDEGFHFIDAIKNAFPPGSMTGAPKIRAMEIIEELEATKRGVFSGSVGYISPEGDFDFNVVIRSILYNQNTNYLSFITGGAITSNSNPEKEYEESMLKAEAMINVLNF